MFESWRCPNPKCEEAHLVKGAKEGDVCEKCQTPLKLMGVKDADAMIKQKKAMVKVDEGSLQILVSSEMTEEEIRSKMYADMMDLASHEAGTGWMRVGTLLSGSSTDQILGAGLKALIDQNKILIRQNELIIRRLESMKT